MTVRIGLSNPRIIDTLPNVTPKKQHTSHISDTLQSDCQTFVHNFGKCYCQYVTYWQIRALSI